MTLFTSLKSLIQHNGPITIAHYMALALTHPQYGYYTKGKVFGREGDFITAPEISQMFGEMVGTWCAANWQFLGEPKKLALVELGPGRGTLMADILRATKHVPGFHQAVSIHLVEVSPQLKKEQQQNITETNTEIIWHETIDTLPEDMPLILVANEFLDALPIHQYIYTGDYWTERMIGLNETHDALCFIDNKQPSEISPILQKYSRAPRGSIVELCPIAETIISELAKRVAAQSGATLWIDYGYRKPTYKSTLQAVKSHTYHNVLEEPGEADITAHVDFTQLKEIASAVPDIYVSSIIGQGEFLQKCGIGMRAQMLMRNASSAQQQDITSAFSRLTDQDQMGELFKVISFASNDNFSKIGF